MDPQKTSSFTFSYRFLSLFAEFSPTKFQIRSGLQFHQGTIDGIRFAYLDAHPENEMIELLICYTDEKGTQRRVRIYGEKNGDRLEPLISFLRFTLKEGFLSGMARRDAYHIMGLEQANHRSLSMIIFTGICLVGVLLSPQFRHGLDGHVEVVTLDRVMRNQLDSHYLELKNVRLNDAMVVYEPRTPTDEKPLEGAWYPIRDNTIAGDNIKVLAYFPADQTPDTSKTQTIRGILRNLGIERVPVQIIKTLETKGSVVSEKVVYIDVGATPTQDMVLFLLIMTIVGGMGLGLIRMFKQRLESSS